VLGLVRDQAQDVLVEEVALLDVARVGQELEAGEGGGRGAVDKCGDADQGR